MNPIVNFVRAGDGVPVIMVHGLAASLYDWDILLPALASAGYAGFALDLLGHGDSIKPRQLSAYTSETVYEHMRDWIHSLDLEQPAVLIGHSLGGYLALQFALREQARVRALVLVNPLYSQDQLPPALRFFLRRPLINVNLIERTPYWLFRLLIDVSSLHFGNSNEKTHSLPEAVRIQTALDYKRAAPGIYNIPRTLRDLTPDLPHISQPTLVIWGARDQTINPKTFPVLVERLPGARGVVMPICGHVPHQCHAFDFNKKVFRLLDSLKD
ncbi:MAG: alpha/beta hydrolase [Anaerolineales bacterium]|nr:alpha/beta hydrolase [Anaerolineales bacterium]